MGGEARGTLLYAEAHTALPCVGARVEGGLLPALSHCTSQGRGESGRGREARSQDICTQDVGPTWGVGWCTLQQGLGCSVANGCVSLALFY